LLTEIARILKPEGICYLSFPPYFSPMGGHVFSPFHYFGEKVALRLVRREDVTLDWVKKLYHIPKNSRSFKQLYKGWGLYKMTISRCKRLIKHAGFNIIDISTRYLPISFVRWPLLGEILTWHVQFLIKKNNAFSNRSSR
jgi:hypothetical protein